MSRHWLKWLAMAGVVLIFAIAPIFWVSAQEPDDPLVLGAWLYEGNCMRCHGDYAQERVGQGTSAKELTEDIEGGGCAVSWGRRAGGPLKSAEIKAIVQYILAWEEQGGPPELPELPPQPTPTLSPTPLPAEGLMLPTPTPTPPPVDETVQLIISGNPLAWGAWLYTQHCYRCHQAYEHTRQGRGATVELLRDTLENGKTSTNMKPFSRKKGGPLKNSEIEAIILFIRTWEELEASPALPAALFTPPTPDPIALEPVALPEILPLQGDAARGASLYALYCQKCHAADGQGRIGPALSKSWPSARPDLTIYATIDRGVPGSLMPAWGQANGGPLPEQDLKDLTAFILKRNMPVQAAIEPETAGVSGIWQGPLGLLALVTGPILLTLIAFMAEPYRRKRKE